MKIIISTKTFSEAINHAILNRCKNIGIFPYKNEIKFCCDVNDLVVHCNFINESECTYAYTFNPIQMHKVMSFLDLLQEQPVLVEFCQYTDTECSIDLTQFTCQF